VPVLPEEPRQLGERPVQILHVLEDLVADDEVEGAVLEGDLAPSIFRIAVPNKPRVPDHRQVLFAFIEGIGAGAVESQAARRLDHRPRTASEVEDPRARAAGRGGLRPAEQVAVMEVEVAERRRQPLSQNVVEGKAPHDSPGSYQIARGGAASGSREANEKFHLRPNRSPIIG
jgi:hypothetical protein